LDALCQEACATDAECPAGLLCVAAGDAPARCLLPALQAGTFRATCSEDAACGAEGVCARLEVEGDAACRCFTPCESAGDPPGPGDGPPDAVGGCALAPGLAPSPGGGSWVVLLGLVGLLRRQSHQRTSRCRFQADSA
ncbi:polyhydroxyalkanoate biosynthesis repressor PhaR, partial [Corallococcus llansteffanensis]